jgi:hypothetical protein
MGTVMDISTIADAIAASVAEDVRMAMVSGQPELYGMSDIRQSISHQVEREVSRLDLGERMRLIAEVPGINDRQVVMPTISFTFGDYVETVLARELEGRLMPLWYELAMEHYAGRMLPIMTGAHELAVELVDGPASRCVRRDEIETYADGLVPLVSHGVVPPDVERLLSTACNFFSPLDQCLADPEWGGPIGISEEGVGHSAAEIGAWFNMVADLQHLAQRRPEEFATALAEEILASPPSP